MNKKWQSGQGSAVRNRKWRSACQKQQEVDRNKKVLGVLTESVETDQSQWRRRVIGPCAVWQVVSGLEDFRLLLLVCEAT